MQTQTNERGFVRYLKDEKFIEWQLLPTDELNEYWAAYLKNNPREEKLVAQAEEHFKNINLSSRHLPAEKKSEIMRRLNESLRRYNRRRKLQIFAYAVSACIAVLILSVLYVQNQRQPDIQTAQSADVIVGSELNSEDIRFISQNRAISFKENIDLEISENGTMQVKNGDNGEEIAIDESVSNKLIVPYGKRSTLTLSDGSRVWLNSGSTLEFPSVFDQNVREVRLTGEMYIEVSSDEKPFLVHTGDFGVRVLGTKFNVSAYEGFSQSVALLEGSVELRSKKGNVALKPNELGLLSQEGDFRKQHVDVAALTSWTNGYLTLNKTPISEVLTLISRYYNLSFDLENDVNLKKRTCTGKLFLSDNLDDIMRTIARLSSTEYSRTEKTIYITNKQ